ncbi:MAG: glycosyltransferase family 9 protein [Bryobacteraceae bacterium]|jgi:ADP-heptose:LPS heptosyltransferase
MRRLIIRPGAIGDCILALPAMDFLRSDYTEVWVARPNVPLIRFVDCVRAIPDTGLDLAGIPGYEPPGALMERLAWFDSIVSWYGAKRPEFREAVSGLPFTFLDALPPGGARIHAADFFLEQVGGAGPAVPRIDCPRAPGEYVVIQPFSGSAKKNWPLERYQELAHRLDARVCWCSGPEEPLDGAVRFDDLYELACWLAGARLCLGNDSGIAHLAAAAEAPVLALFGPSDPALWAPRGERVRVVATPRPGEPMEAIGLDRVLAAAREML